MIRIKCVCVNTKIVRFCRSFVASWHVLSIRPALKAFNGKRYWRAFVFREKLRYIFNPHWFFMYNTDKNEVERYKTWTEITITTLNTAKRFKYFSQAKLFLLTVNTIFCNFLSRFILSIATQLVYAIIVAIHLVNHLLRSVQPISTIQVERKKRITTDLFIWSKKQKIGDFHRKYNIYQIEVSVLVQRCM